MDNNEWAHIDLGNQINNSWNKDSALALKLNGFSRAVKIRANDKKNLRDKHIKPIISRKDERNNMKIIIIIYSFLLFKLLDNLRKTITKVKLCNDISPHDDVYRFLNKICQYYCVKNLCEDIKIRFKEKAEGKSKAHNIANAVYKGRRKEDYLIKTKDIEELDEIIRIFGKDGS